MKKRMISVLLFILIAGEIPGVAMADDHLIAKYIPLPDFSLHNKTLVKFFVENTNMEPINHTKITDNKPPSSYVENGTTYYIPGFTIENYTNLGGFCQFIYGGSRSPTNITVTYPDGTKDILHFNIPSPPTNGTTHIFYVEIIKNLEYQLKDLGYKNLAGKKAIFIKAIKNGNSLVIGSIVSKGVNLGEIKGGFGLIITDKTVEDLDLEINGKVYTIISSYDTKGDISDSTEIDDLFLNLSNDNQSTATRATSFIKEHPIIAAFGGFFILVFLIMVISTTKKRRW